MNAETFLGRVRDAEWLDAADRRLVAMLRGRVAAGDADGDAFVVVVATLLRACAEGSLCLPLNAERLGVALRDRLFAGGFFDDDDRAAPAPEALAARFLAAADAGSYAGAMGAPDSPRPLIRAHGNLYLHRFWLAEHTVAEGLSARLRNTPPAIPDDAIRTALRETQELQPLRDGNGSPIVLTERQRDALETALHSPVFVLSGGPGTGKTTWTAAWLRAVMNLSERLPGAAPERVRLCAPTGRAARRLEESLRSSLGADEGARAVPVTTLHALLGYRAREGRFARGPGDPVDADWILLDEASMADVFLLAALLRALRPGTRLVLAGDPDQLPAVEAGSVLAELLPDEAGTPGPVPSVTLDTGHRSGDAITFLAGAVRSGGANSVIAALGAPVPAVEVFKNAHAIAHIGPSSPEEALRAYAAAAFGTGGGYLEMLQRFRTLPREEEASALDALWKRAGRTRVLSPLRRGRVSAEGANRILRGLLEPVWRRPGDARGPGFHGAPVLITRNDERTGLSNGDVGLWLETAEGAAAFFPRAEIPGGWLRLPAALLPPCELGFASTIHKSQGSECDEVLVLLPDAGSPLLVRETLYTAITRAKSAVRIYGPEASIRQAVERKMRRDGGLRGMMKDEMME